MVAGTKFMHRVSDKAEVVTDSFILTDNSTGFDVPAENIDEGMLYESRSVGNISPRLGELKSLLHRFLGGGRNRYSEGHWTITTDDGSRDNWKLSYDDKLVIECIENYSTYKNALFSYVQACKVAGVVESYYGHEMDMSIYDEKE